MQKKLTFIGGLLAAIVGIAVVIAYFYFHLDHPLKGKVTELKFFLTGLLFILLGYVLYGEEKSIWTGERGRIAVALIAALLTTIFYSVTWGVGDSFLYAVIPGLLIGIVLSRFYPKTSS